MNAAEILSVAVDKLDIAQLASAVRQLGDDTLAALVRDHRPVKQAVMVGLIESIMAAADGGAGKKSAKRKPTKPRAAAAPPANRDGVQTAVAAEVQKAGADGTTSGGVATALGIRQLTVRQHLLALVEAKRLRRQGEGRGTRYYAV